MFGGLLALFSAVGFAFGTAIVRRGVLTGTVLQAVGFSLPVALPVFLAAMALTGGVPILLRFSGESWLLLAIAGVIHFAWARYCNYRATRAIGINLVGPIQQLSLVIALVLAILWLDEPLTLLRAIGIVLVMVGPMLTHERRRKPATSVGPETPGETAFVPNYAEGYFYSLLSTIGFGVSPILIRMAFVHKGIAVGIAGGFVSYLAATAAVALTMLLPGQWKSFCSVDRKTAILFTVSGVTVCLSQMFRYMALAVAPVSVVTPIQRLSIVFRIYFSSMINPHHEVFGGRVVAGTVVSLIGAIALSASIDSLGIHLQPQLAAWLGWHWP